MSKSITTVIKHEALVSYLKQDSYALKVFETELEDDEKYWWRPPAFFGLGMAVAILVATLANMVGNNTEELQRLADNAMMFAVCIIVLVVLMAWLNLSANKNRRKLIAEVKGELQP